MGITLNKYGSPQDTKDSSVLTVEQFNELPKELRDGLLGIMKDKFPTQFNKYKPKSRKKQVKKGSVDIEVS